MPKITCMEEDKPSCIDVGYPQCENSEFTQIEHYCCVRFWDTSTNTVNAVKRNYVVATCPDPKCGDHDAFVWRCYRCDYHLEYGMDQFLYCSCGKSAITNFEFRCPLAPNGESYVKPNPIALNAILSQIQPMKELNILILGETGVGKSTWINSFVNFLTFRSLEAAESNPGLLSLIPTSFNVCDSSCNEITVTTGNDANEVHSVGQSATQECKTYSFDVGDIRLRILDTPGIGDTRGTAQDKLNFHNVLSTLSNLDELHGICILLKPNNSRLNIYFDFCFKELLTYLHRDASQNIVFCFTNSRGTFYRPGDTLPSLRQLLSRLNGVTIPLDPSTIYCFDSEAYRFIAATKNNPPVKFDESERECFSTSWKKSVTETVRMLNHIRNLPPHPIRHTMNLNHVKQIVSGLARPLADTTRLIHATKNVLEDRLTELNATKATLRDLKNKLRFEVPALKIVELDYPQTVCTNNSCKQFLGPNKSIRYTSICHAHCYLQGVTHDCVGDEGLIGCYAMKAGVCWQQFCGHSYKEHMHAYYLTEETTEMATDAVASEMISKNMAAKEVKKEMIQNLEKKIEEYSSEMEEIQKASVLFACFLKHHAITPYNDVTLEYCELLIKSEREKVCQGANDAVLKQLEVHRDEYKNEIALVQASLASEDTPNSAIDPTYIESVAAQLRRLKHNGEVLQRCLDAAEFSRRNIVTFSEVRGVPNRRRSANVGVLEGFVNHFRSAFW